MFKRKRYLALAVLLILGIGGFILFRPTATPDPVKIYKTVTPVPKTIQTDTVEVPSYPNDQTQPLSDPTLVQEDEAKNTTQMPPKKNEEKNEAEVTTPNTEASEELYFGDYTEEELIEIRDWGKDLEARLMQKFPKISELTRLTPEEIAEKYPTDEDRAQLATRAQEYFNAYLEETRAFLVTVPEPLRELALAKLHLQLAENWGRAEADEAMEKFADLIK